MKNLNAEYNSAKQERKRVEIKVPIYYNNYNPNETNLSFIVPNADYPDVKYGLTGRQGNQREIRNLNIKPDQLQQEINQNQNKYGYGSASNQFDPYTSQETGYVGQAYDPLYTNKNNQTIVSYQQSYRVHQHDPKQLENFQSYLKQQEVLNEISEKKYDWKTLSSAPFSTGGAYYINTGRYPAGGNPWTGPIRQLHLIPVENGQHPDVQRRMEQQAAQHLVAIGERNPDELIQNVVNQNNNDIERERVDQLIQDDNIQIEKQGQLQALNNQLEKEDDIDRLQEEGKNDTVIQFAPPFKQQQKYGAGILKKALAVGAVALAGAALIGNNQAEISLNNIQHQSITPYPHTAINQTQIMQEQQGSNNYLYSNVNYNVNEKMGKFYEQEEAIEKIGKLSEYNKDTLTDMVNLLDGKQKQPQQTDRFERGKLMKREEKRFEMLQKSFDIVKKVDDINNQLVQQEPPPKNIVIQKIKSAIEQNKEQAYIAQEMLRQYHDKDTNDQLKELKVVQQNNNLILREQQKLFEMKYIDNNNVSNANGGIKILKNPLSKELRYVQAIKYLIYIRLKIKKQMTRDGISISPKFTSIINTNNHQNDLFVMIDNTKDVINNLFHTGSNNIALGMVSNSIRSQLNELSEWMNKQIQEEKYQQMKKKYKSQ